MFGLYINCCASPFIDLILSGLKRHETRTRDMLRPLAGQRVYLVETGTGPVPMVRASAVISAGRRIPFTDTAARVAAHIAGTPYDIKPGGEKVFYRLTKVRSLRPFPLPEAHTNHGRAYCEF